MARSGLTIWLDFRKIARWEIDLRREIRIDRKLRTVTRGGVDDSVRRVFSAKVHTGDSNKTTSLPATRLKYNWEVKKHNYQKLRMIPCEGVVGEFIKWRKGLAGVLSVRRMGNRWQDRRRGPRSNTAIDNLLAAQLVDSVWGLAPWALGILGSESRPIFFPSGTITRRPPLRVPFEFAAHPFSHGISTPAATIAHHGSPAESQTTTRTSYLLPYGEYISLHRPSFILQVYLYACWDVRKWELLSSPAFAIASQLRMFYKNLRNCISQQKGIFQKVLEGGEACHARNLNSQQTLWIRGSTGRLILEFAPREINEPPIWICPSKARTSNTHACIDWNDPTWEARALEALSIGEFNYLSSFGLARYRALAVNAEQVGEIRLGTALCSSSVSERFEDYTEIASSAMADFRFGWYSQNGMEHRSHNGWTRFHSTTMCGEEIIYRVSGSDKSGSLPRICHVGRLFKQLQITLGQENFVFPCAFQFIVQVASLTKASSEGYLFLCPTAHLCGGSAGSFARPESVYFWSTDAEGSQRLSAEEAAARKFPTIELRTELICVFWDARVYEILKKFHELKGFDVESQDNRMWEIYWDNGSQLTARIDEVDTAGLFPKNVPVKETTETSREDVCAWVRSPAWAWDWIS
ncbi:hypothetical protein FB45DRAFT_864400 [Roridomyces roridus]|uniref:Uncharacterized protein n=1 Tax=Roridomyces roridus TaxID=1738132 RepID=A0AAD7C121_9AGAR|nr:hypothetical protein FB45DRAFT_864400 [Roridomyces roridus]